jgi:pilus assembly protein CpaC
VGKGSFLSLPRPITDVFVVTPGIADVEVRSNRELFVYGLRAGETAIYATDENGETVYEATVQVMRNIDQVREMLRLAMPRATIDVKSIGGYIILDGIVRSEQEVKDVEELVQKFMRMEKDWVLSRVRAATPQQVNLRVRFIEINRAMTKQLGVNLQGLDVSDDFVFGVTRGREAVTGGEGNPFVNAIDGQFEIGGNSIYGIGSLFGLDFNIAVDALAQDGLATVLAEPNLTTISGTRASFNAGGEFPIAVSDGLGGINVQFKRYGVMLDFTPQVLSENRIRLQVKPTVSELTDAGAVVLDGISIPALSTRTVTATVELGSGQSFVLGGLLRNNANSAVEKTPILGDIPVLGALFRSQSFRRSETELMVIVTPYLVKPVSERIATPLDGLRAPSEAENYLLGNLGAPTDTIQKSAIEAGTQPARPGFSLD